MSEGKRIPRLSVLLIAVCAVLGLADLFFDKHGHFDWEGRFGFHAAFGFLAVLFIILAGKYLRRLLMRDEDYYDH